MTQELAADAIEKPGRRGGRADDVKGRARNRMAIAATRCWEMQAERLCATNMGGPFWFGVAPYDTRPAGTGKDGLARPNGGRP
jgi:hypothetical protein